MSYQSLLFSCILLSIFKSYSMEPEVLSKKEIKQLNNQLLKIVQTGSDISDVDLLIRQGASVNARDENGVYVLTHAAAIGNMEVVELLLSSGAFVDQQAVSHATASRSSTEQILWRLLIEDKNILDERVSKLPINTAAACGFLEKLNKLVEAGANIHGNNEGPLGLAIQYGHIHIVERLIELGANYRYGNDYLLRLAVACDQLPCVLRLLSLGADINAKNRQGQNSLDVARTEIMKFFLAQYKIYETQFDQVLKSAHKNGKSEIINLCRLCGHEDFIYFLNNPINYIDGQFIALDESEKCFKKAQIMIVWASIFGLATVVQHILKKAPKWAKQLANACCPLKRRVLTYAAQYGRLYVVNTLLLHGAKIPTQALRLAADNNHKEVTAKLLFIAKDIANIFE